MSAATLAALGLVARLCASAQAAAAVGPPAVAVQAAPDVQLEAESIARDPASGAYVLEGGVVLRRGAVTLRARAARFDRASGEVIATGDVLLTDVARVVAADGVRAVLGGAFEAEGVVAFLKDGAVDVSGASTLDEARAAGRNRLSLSGSSVSGDGSGRLRLEGARLTLCDCGGHAPSWEIRAREADVIPGKRAILSRPVLRITPRFLFVDHPVPVLALPWLYLPLADRQTGLLLPQIASSGATGFAFQQPLFVTLGRSADLTLTAGYALGSGEPSGDVKGPSARLELRWAPAVGTEGRAELTWLRDLADEADGAGGNRYAIALRHAQRFSDLTSLRADVALFGDPYLPRDFTADVLARTTPYRRSDVLVEHRRDLLVLGLDAAYLQPLAGQDEVDYGRFGAEVDALHRLPSLSATFLPTAVGPLRVEGRAGMARFAPVSRLTDSPAFGGLRDPALRRTATRADVRAEVGVPLVAGAVSFEPFLRGAAVGYAFEEPDERLGRAWTVGGARLSTELGRSFGAVRHRIAPRVEWLLGSAASGAEPLDGAYDALDRAGTGAVGAPLDPSDPSGPQVAAFRPTLTAAPPGRFQQLRASVENRIAVGGTEVLRLELGQDLDVERGRLAETFFEGAGRAGPFSADARGRFLAFDGRLDPVQAPAPPPPASRFLDRFTELGAHATFSSRRGDAVRVGLLAVGSGASGALVAGIDPLFDLAPAPLRAAAQASAGARMVLGPGAFTYDVLFPARPGTFQCSPSEPPRPVGALHVQQHVGSFTWDSPCRCFRVVAAVGLNQCDVWSYSFALDLAQLGSRAFPR